MANFTNNYSALTASSEMQTQSSLILLNTDYMFPEIIIIFELFSTFFTV